MDIIHCTTSWDPQFLIFTSQAPKLLYYSHIPTALIALFLGILVFIKSRHSLVSKILLFISVVFSLWSFIDLYIWTNSNSSTMAFFWSLINLLEMLVSASILYFAYVFIEKKDAPFKYKAVVLSLFLPFIFLIPTKINLAGFDLTICEATQGKLVYYFYFLESLFSLWLLSYLIKRVVTTYGEERKRIIYASLGTSLFLVAFSGANIIGSAIVYFSGSDVSGTGWEITQYGLFGMVVFMGFLAYLIVKFKAFNIKLFGAQFLVSFLLFFVGSLLFIGNITTMRVIVWITLAIALAIGLTLIKSVKKEVEQREALEIANKEITERKEELQKMADSLSITNEKLKIAYDKLEELNRAKADFIGLANHQLKHAPTTIKSFMSMLLDGDYGEVPESQIKVLKNVNDANDRQIRLADDLLQIIKMESNKVQLDFQKQSIEDVCRGVYDNLSAAAKERSLKLSYEKPEQALPEVLFDKNKVFEAIFNFVDNAIKYTKEGGITVKAEVSPSSNYKPQNSDDVDKKPIHGSVVRVVVSDTGSGISKEHLGQLFAKFSRKDTSNLNSGGTGLGLFLVKLMIEAHGGRTWAESDGEGKGSRFIMELPIETPKEILDQIGAKK